jgi:hypothetical protein
MLEYLLKNLLLIDKHLVPYPLDYLLPFQEYQLLLVLYQDNLQSKFVIILQGRRV